MMKLLNILVLFIAITLIGCQKWKEPTDVDFYVDINKTATLNNQLTFTGGHLIIESFDFDADREKGDDVLFEEDYVDGLTISFNGSTSVSELNFIIPQGVYKRLDIGFRTFDDENDQLASILVEGNYTYIDGSSAPIRFEFTDSEVFKIRAENEMGGDIVLDKDVVSPAKITLDPPYWFQTVPLNYFETATLTDIEGVNTIVITKSENDNIFDLVLDRIDETALVVFNY